MGAGTRAPLNEHVNGYGHVDDDTHEPRRVHEHVQAHEREPLSSNLRIVCLCGLCRIRRSRSSNVRTATLLWSTWGSMT